MDLEVDLGLALLVDLERESLRLDLVVVELVGLDEDLFRRLRVVGVHFPTCGSARLDLGQESIRLRTLGLVHEVILRVVLPLGLREEQRGALQSRRDLESDLAVGVRLQLGDSDATLLVGSRSRRHRQLQSEADQDRSDCDTNQLEHGLSVETRHDSPFLCGGRSELLIRDYWNLMIYCTSNYSLHN